VRGLPPIPVVCLVLACAKPAADSAPPEPAPEPQDDGGFEFVSTEHNEEDTDQAEKQAAPKYDREYAITTATAAKELAENTVADRLNPKQTWESSPLLPAAWPDPEHKVRVYFYPLAANPSSLEHFQLFSAAFAVTISLEDGTTTVDELKAKKLGTVQSQRPSRLEREELELAETSLVHYILSGDTDGGENAFWGYLKYMHEHPKLARDIAQRQPKFVAWLKARNARG